MDTELWYDNSNSAGHTLVTVTYNGNISSGAALDTFEWSGISTSSPLDKTNSGNSGAGATTFSSGSTGTLTQAAEVAFGGSFGNGIGSFTFTGPASPWTNEPQLAPTSQVKQISGYQQVSATTALTYSGTTSVTAGTASVIATFKLATAGAPSVRQIARARPAAVKGRLASIQIAPPRTGGPAAPFFPPHALFRGAAAAVKGRLTGARGQPGAPAPFRPFRLLRGQPAARPGKLTGFAVLPPLVRSRFEPPPILFRGQPAARPGRLTGARGRPGVPSPFHAPAAPLRGQPAARRGRLAGIVAPPPVIQPNVPAPFFPPHTLLRGQVPITARTPSTHGFAPPPPPPPVKPPHWQGSTHPVSGSGNLILGANHTGIGGPGADLKGDYERSGD